MTIVDQVVDLLASGPVSRRDVLDRLNLSKDQLKTVVTNLRSRGFNVRFANEPQTIVSRVKGLADKNGLISQRKALDELFLSKSQFKSAVAKIRSHGNKIHCVDRVYKLEVRS